MKIWILDDEKATKDCLVAHVKSKFYPIPTHVLSPLQTFKYSNFTPFCYLTFYTLIFHPDI